MAVCHIRRNRTAVNGVYSIIDTATIETYYTDKIKSDDRIRRLTDGAVFEIKGEPENIEMRFYFKNQSAA